jgi:hypothetical protein
MPAAPGGSLHIGTKYHRGYYYTSNSSLKNQSFVSAFKCNNGNRPAPIPGIGGPGYHSAVKPLTADPDVYAATPNILGTISDTSTNYNPRLLQFALKYQF